jgi:hypothetical protein
MESTKNQENNLEFVEDNLEIEDDSNFEYTDEKLMKGEYFLQQKKVDVSINITLRMRDFCENIALPLCEKLDCNLILNLIN